MSTNFAIARLTAGELNALVKNLMRQMNITDAHEAVRRVNSAEWIIFPNDNRIWRESDNVIYITLPPTIGRTGPQWISHLEAQNIIINDDAKLILKSDDFKPTIGVITEIGIIRGNYIPSDCCRTGKIRRFAKTRELGPPTLESVCMAFDAITTKVLRELGINWLNFMNEPVYGNILVLEYTARPEMRFQTIYGGSQRSWHPTDNDGFVFDVTNPPEAAKPPDRFTMVRGFVFPKPD